LPIDIIKALIAIKAVNFPPKREVQAPAVEPATVNNENKEN
jgi:hypothetical protein